MPKYKHDDNFQRYVLTRKKGESIFHVSFQIAKGNQIFQNEWKTQAKSPKSAMHSLLTSLMRAGILGDMCGRWVERIDSE